MFLNGRDGIRIILDRIGKGGLYGFFKIEFVRREGDFGFLWYVYLGFIV